MKSKSITAATALENYQLSDNIAAILITKNAAFTTEEFSGKVAETGKEDIQHSVGLQIKKLGEIHAQSEGFMLAFKIGGKEHMFILVGLDGGIQFTEKKKFVINLKGLDNTKDYEVFAIGGSRISNQMLTYTRSTVIAGDNYKPVPLGGIRRAFVGNVAALDTIKVNLPTHTNEHPVDELKALNNLMNDIVRATQSVTDSAAASGDTVKFGYVDLFGVPNAVLANSMGIVTNGATEVEYFIEKVTTV